MANDKVFNREVFILIDTSGSMWDKDFTTGGKSKHKFLLEKVQGHVGELLNYEYPNDETKICDSVTVYFFGAKEKRNCSWIIISETSALKPAWIKNQPIGGTIIAPALKKALSQWFERRSVEPKKNALIIIYTDGMFDDPDEFTQEIKNTCQGIDSQDEIKILIIGMGAEVLDEKFIDFHLEPGCDASEFKTKSGEDCNIVTFNLLKEVDKMGGIIEALSDQLSDNPGEGIANWIKNDYPKLYKKYWG